LLRLAGWADERCRAAGPDLLDERATHGTQLAFAVSDQEFREVPRLVVQVLLKCQAAQFQCMSKLEADGGVKHVTLGRSDVGGFAQGMQPGREQDVLDVDVADARDVLLVHENRLDRAPLLFYQYLFECVWRELAVVQRVETQRACHGMGSELDGLDRVDVPEPPEVLAEGTAVVEQDG